LAWIDCVIQVLFAEIVQPTFHSAEYKIMSIALDQVFHPTDFSEGNQSAMAHALRLAQLARGEFSVLHVTEPNTDVEWGAFPPVRKLLQQWGLLGEGAEHEDVVRLGLLVKKVVRSGKKAVPVISKYVADHEPDLIVLSTHQRKGMARWLSDATAEPIARSSKVATLFVPRQVHGFISKETGNIMLKRILIPIHHAPMPHGAVEAAVRLAEICECDDVVLTTLYVGKEGDQPSVEIPLRDGWQVEHLVREGDVVEHILSCSEDNHADLIVMATQGQNGFLDALRGSTTEQVLQQAKCPLLAIPR
jgi:nucleotide-binding universal stress UspA family protein